jgi:hypothetical protein
MTSLPLPDGYRVVETRELVPVRGQACWTRWGAERWCRQMNRLRIYPSYRWEVEKMSGRVMRKWWVNPYQNRLEKIET